MFERCDYVSECEVNLDEMKVEQVNQLFFYIE